MVLFFIPGTGRYVFSFSCVSLGLDHCLTNLELHIQQIDESPLDGQVFDREGLEQLSKEGVTLVSVYIFLTLKRGLESHTAICEN